MYTYSAISILSKDIEMPVEGNTYLVYRPNPDTGEPTYSLCIYKNGCWVPQILDNFITLLPEFQGVPLTDEDRYVVCADIFTPVTEGDDISEATIEQNWKHLKDFVNRLRDELNEVKHTVDDLRNRTILLELKQQTPSEPLTPITPYVPHIPTTTPYIPYPSTPTVPDWPYGPIISYVTPAGSEFTSTISNKNTSLEVEKK